MGPNADRAIQLLRDAADDLEPREAYVFEPEGPVEGVAHFIGGAALGTFPQVAYKALLTRVAQRCGVAVVATPFDLGLDHDAVAYALLLMAYALWDSEPVDLTPAHAWTP